MFGCISQPRSRKDSQPSLSEIAPGRPAFPVEFREERFRSPRNSLLVPRTKSQDARPMQEVTQNMFRTNSEKANNGQQIRDRKGQSSPPLGRSSGVGMKRLDKWIAHLLNEGVTRNGVDQRSVDWSYADDVRVTMAPLASGEEEDRYRGPSRGQTVLQNLREQKEQLDINEKKRTLPNMNTRSSSPSVRSATLGSTYRPPSHEPQFRPVEPPFRSAEPPRPVFQRDDSFSQRRNNFEDMLVVFLQANDEVKRTIFPPTLHSMEEVKMAFVRAFPNITRAYMEQSYVKIYIQEYSKGQLFYELEDLSEIRNKSVLKLREQQQSGVVSPTRFLDHPDYLSETEHDDGRRFLSLGRPASAMAQTDYGPPKPIRQKSFDPYFDPYVSDSASHDSRSVTRSGSATPIIDRESRARMETMERQLTNLSTLVHSALVTKGMSESTQKDMMDLRKQILAMHGEVRETSEEPSSIPESLSSHTHMQLGGLKNKVQQASTEIRQLRRAAQVNAHTARNIIKDAETQIADIINVKRGEGGGSRQAEQLEIMTSEYGTKLTSLLEQLTDFEQNVESVRSSVLTTNKKLRMTEVEKMTETLTVIGRSAADLKTEFPPIQESMEQKLKKDMERMLAEEKFIKEQSSAIDQSLRRCKALANIMVTMKKLAMVQDPSISRINKKDGASTVSSSPVPMGQPSHLPTSQPSHLPTSQPSHLPTSQPSHLPISQPSHLPTSQPSHLPESQPSYQPSHPPPVPSHPPPPGPHSNVNPSSNGNANRNSATPTPVQGQHQMPPADPSFEKQSGSISVARVAASFVQTPHGGPTLPEITPQEPSQETSNISVLDGLLDEVGQPGQPPRPPSRFSVQDVRTKFTKPPELPEQIKSLIDDVARRASPALERDPVAERRQDLEERQERLAEKQRQLKSQFQQLQQLTPLP